MTDGGGIRSLAEHLKGMRWGAEEYRSGSRSKDPDASARIAQLLERYDEGLLKAAAMLGLKVPGAPLSDESREHLEEALRSQGMDL